MSNDDVKSSLYPRLKWEDNFDFDYEVMRSDSYKLLHEVREKIMPQFLNENKGVFREDLVRDSNCLIFEKSEFQEFFGRKTCVLSNVTIEN